MMKINMIKMLAILITVLIASGCSDINSPNVDDSVSSVDITTLDGALATAGKVVQKVSVGGADICAALGQPTGCDANYSLSAIQYEDGTVKGQYQDTVKEENGNLQLHVAVDCMIVDGNEAIVGGVLTKGDENGAYYPGRRVVTKVADNGTSSMDPKDQISFTTAFVNPNITCTDVENFAFDLFDLEKGQVTIK